MQSNPTQEHVILEAVRDRLIEIVPDFNTQNCWFDDQPVPWGNETPPFNVFCTVSPVDGHFDQEKQIGGGICNIQEYAGFSVNVGQRNEVEQPKKLDAPMVRAERSLIRYFKPMVLSAILVDGSDPANRQDWMPKDRDGNLLLTDKIRAVRSVSPKRLENWPLLLMSIEFLAAWRWQL